MSKKIIVIIIGIVIFFTGGYILRDIIYPLFFFSQKSSEVLKGTRIIDVPEDMIKIVAEELEIPWEMEFLPGGDMLITERPGRLVLIGREKYIIPIDNVRHIGEGGLMGMALHPQFEENHWLYLYMTTDTERGLENRVERYLFTEGVIYDREIILDGIPGSRFHNGGRIAFGPDGYLYITTGDAQNPELAQDIKSLAGKILRVRDDGSVPEDNPFDNEIYSLGHRNPQGIVWDDEGRLWSTEHGPTARDEINLIRAGGNYGWPIITGSEQKEEMETPIINSGKDYTWAPAGIVYLNKRIFFGGLRGQALYEFMPDQKIIRDHFKQEFGRIRIVKVGPDGYLYIGTSNMDGRIIPNAKDDKIIRLDVQSLNR